MKGIHLIYVILPILSLIAWQQGRAASLRDQLVQVRNELASKKQRLAQVRVQERTTMQQIKQNEARMQHQSKRIQGAEKQIQTLQSQIVRKQKMADEVKHIKSERETLQAGRIVEMYKQIVAKDEMTILEMPSGMSHLATVCFVSAVEQDRRLITRHVNSITSLEHQQADLQVGKRQQETVRANDQREYTRLGKNVYQHKTVLASVQKEQERIAAEIKEYESKQQRLKCLLVRLIKPPKKNANTDGRRNSLPQSYRPAPPMPSDFVKFNLPVSGRIIRGYGLYRHPEWGTSTFSSGVTIAANAGLPVKNIAGGNVVYAGLLKGYGNMMIIEHGQQVFSVYGNLGSMMKRVGTQVVKGEVIALVGAEDTEEPSLYFELRSRGKAVNPSRWII